LSLTRYQAVPLAEPALRRRLKLAPLEALLAFSIVALVVQLFWPLLSDWRQRPRAGGQVEQKSATYNYLAYLPQQYDRGDERWPLLLFLHGSGNRGFDLQALMAGGPPGLIAQGRHFPMIVASPQCPFNEHWRSDFLVTFLDEVSARFRVDPDRVYVTGYSMGGYGTWDLATVAPERLAAIAPLSGGGDVSLAHRLAELPIWAFHGEIDQTVPAAATKQMVEAAEDAGASPQLTLYAKKGHDICDSAYRTPELYAWLLSKRRPESANLLNQRPRAE